MEVVAQHAILWVRLKNCVHSEWSCWLKAEENDWSKDKSTGKIDRIARFSTRKNRELPVNFVLQPILGIGF